MNIKDLKPIWDLISVHWRQDQAITNIVGLFEYSDSISGDLFVQQYKNTRLKDFPDLLSDSVESRVLAFRKFILNFMNGVKVNNSGAHFASSVAMAAFLVGRSTSHVFLLKDIGKEIPAVFAWFGLIAGVVGPKYWDVEWTRASKGIEKGLRARLNWAEPTNADISWPEYEWLTVTYRGNSPFADFPKQLPKVLALEVVPGAICQLRLKQDTNVSVGAKSELGVNRDELKELKSLLADFVGLSERARNQLSASHVAKGLNDDSEHINDLKINKRTRRPSVNPKKT